MKKYSVALVVALVVAFAAPVLANPFSDVPFSHWAYDAVKKLTDKGIMIGMPDGTFKGEKGVNRYELAVTLARALDKLPSMKGKVDALTFGPSRSSPLNSQTSWLCSASRLRRLRTSCRPSVTTSPSSRLAPTTRAAAAAVVVKSRSPAMPRLASAA